MKKQIKRIHFLGIGGVSQSAIALILKNDGFFISGSDSVESEKTKHLESVGIDVCINGVSENIPDCDLVVVSAAIKEDDKELVLAKQLRKDIITRAQMLGKIASRYENVISIAGTHGKTTTTGMIASIFLKANLNPTIHIGGFMREINGNVCVGGKDFFITEACEYVDSFLELKSDVGVVLNVQPDHLDYFKTFDNIKASFKKFTQNIKKEGLIIYCADDKNACGLGEGKSIGYSVNGAGVVCARNIKEYEKGRFKFSCCLFDKKLFTVKLKTYGVHNVSNALAAIIVALKYGIDKKIIKKALEEFSGIDRRFQDYGLFCGAKVFHDYAHHPTEISATIKTAKRLAKGGLYVVFQPHTYSRTKTLLNGFLECFEGSEEILVYKVYSAREKPEYGIDEKELTRRLKKKGENAFYFDDYNIMEEHIRSKIKKGDVLLILGAGDIESFASYIKRESVNKVD